MFLIVTPLRRVSIMMSSSAVPVVLHMVMQLAVQDIRQSADMREKANSVAAQARPARAGRGRPR